MLTLATHTLNSFWGWHGAPLLSLAFWKSVVSQRSPPLGSLGARLGCRVQVVLEEVPDCDWAQWGPGHCPQVRPPSAGSPANGQGRGAACWPPARVLPCLSSLSQISLPSAPLVPVTLPRRLLPEESNLQAYQFSLPNPLQLRGKVQTQSTGSEPQRPFPHFFILQVLLIFVEKDFWLSLPWGLQTSPLQALRSSHHS